MLASNPFRLYVVCFRGGLRVGAALVSQVLFKLSGMACMLARMTQLVHSLCRLEWLCLATLEKNY